MAGGDEKRLAKLGRYASPTAVAEALRNAEERLSKGDFKIAKPEGDDATPEKLAEWRKGQGIPETHDKYELKLPQGVVVGEADKPLLDGFLKSMHGQDATPGEVNRAVSWYFEQQEAQRQATLEADQTYKDQNIELLQKEMGADFKRNMRLVGEFLKDAPEGVAEKIMGGRGPDGRLFAADAKVISWLTNMALEKNPIASVMGGGGSAAVQALETELAGLEKQMGDPKSDYWKKGEVGQKLQARYRELTAAKGAAAGG